MTPPPHPDHRAESSATAGTARTQRRPAHQLTADALSLGYRSTPVVHEVSLEIPAGKITSVIGPNGCGKSTLLHGLAGQRRPLSGTVSLDGRHLTGISPRELATLVGLLPQSPLAPEGTTVADLVALGRHPHRRWIHRWGPEDDAQVRRALDLTGVTDLADRRVEALSGGQRQRVWLALTLAQDTDLVLLDEPTTYLDVAHALELMEVVGRLKDDGRTVVMVLHDLPLATRYSDHLVAMSAGRVVAQGPPAQILTEELLAEVFGLDARILDDPFGHGPLVVPLGPARRPGED